MNKVFQTLAIVLKPGKVQNYQSFLIILNYFSISNLTNNNSILFPRFNKGAELMEKFFFERFAEQEFPCDIFLT